MLKDYSWFTKENILKQLSNLNVNVDRYKMVVDFIFQPCIVYLIDKIDSEFNSELGAPAYSRLQLLAILLFAEIRGVNNLEEISSLCKTDDIFKVITPTDKPSRNTLSSLANLNDELPFLSIFLFTLVKLNDYNFLPDDSDLFLDGTDGIVNADVTYTISEDDIEALELMDKWDLIHDLSEIGIRKSKTNVECKLRKYKNNPEMTKIIGLILKNIEMFNKNVFNKVDELKNALVDSNKDYVVINFPESVKMKTKRGKWDAALNVQEIMTSNSIVFSGILQRKPNDQGTLNGIIQALKENLCILLKLQEKFGERRNFKELENRFLKSKIFCDSGYDGEENIKTILISKMNFIPMPKKVSRKINDELRKRNNNKETKTKKKKNKTLKNNDDYTIRDCKRIKNGYKCSFEKELELKDVKLKNNAHNKQENLPKPLLEYDYYYECHDCSGCPYFNKYGEKCSIAKYKETTTEFHYELINSFVSGKYPDYNKRFPISEGINGYLKRKNGILRLRGRNLISATNHLHIKNIIYNLIRFVNLKGSAW